MKTNFVLFALVLVCFCSAKAQSSYFNTGNFNKELPGTILTKDGQLIKANITYEHPDFLKLPSSPLKTSNGPVDKSTLEAFSIDGKTWVFRANPIAQHWVILQRQGAIEVYDYLTSDSKGNVSAVITIGSVIRKGKDQLIQSDLMLGYKKKMTPLVSDNAELSAKVGEKGYGALQYLNVVDEYNAWSEKTNPGKVTYLPAELGVKVPEGGTVMAVSGGAVAAAATSSNPQPSMAQQKTVQDDAFAGRSTTVSPELASAKDNVPVKKETFGGKMNRIKSDGNKIGVVLQLKPARVNPTPPQTGTVALTTYAVVPGEYMDETLLEAGAQLVAELNAAYGVSNFELIDINQIPYREVKVLGTQTKMNDYWATKYKVVFAYTLDPQIQVTQESSGGYAASLDFRASMIITEYIGGPGSTKQDILMQILNMGGFGTAPVVQKESFTDVNEVYQKVQTKLDRSIVEKVKKERAPNIDKIVKKLTK